MPDLTSLARELVAALVHLKENPQATPPHGRDAYRAIREEYALNQNTAPDPLLAAAERFVLGKLQDVAAPESQPQAFEPQPAPPSPEPGPAPFSVVEAEETPTAESPAPEPETPEAQS